jgi:hypothetical protein
VVNGGRLEGETERDGKVTYRFSSLRPSWRMDFAVADYSTRDPARHREVYHEISHLWGAPPTDLPSPRCTIATRFASGLLASTFAADQGLGIRCAAVALNEAVMRLPTSSPISRIDRRVPIATTGIPQSTSIR